MSGDGFVQVTSAGGASGATGGVSWRSGRGGGGGGAETNVRADGGMNSAPRWGQRVRRACRQRSVSAAVVDAALVLQVVVTVLTNPHRRRDLQPHDLRLETATPGRQDRTG